MPETVPTTRVLQADPSEAGLRLDVILGAHLEGGRSQAQRLVRQGLVLVGTTVVRRPSQTVRAGDLIELQEEPAAVAEKSTPQEARLVYQDELVVVVDKPAGMVVHPGPGHRDGTLAQLVQTWGGEWSQAGGSERAGIVHRLDRGTSGLLVLARTEEAHRELARQLRTRTMGREYWGLAQGGFREDRGRIEAAIGRDPKRPRRMAVGAGGRDATTEFTVLERWPEHTALQLRLRTGRTHQIRVHLAYIGRPLAGDALYGPGSMAGSARPALHAAMLHFNHPRDGQAMTFQSPLPEDLQRLRIEVGAELGSRAAWPWQDRSGTVL